MDSNTALLSLYGGSAASDPTVPLQQQTRFLNLRKNADAPASPAVSDQRMQRIQKTSTDFEAVFLNEMMGHMFPDDEESEFFGDDAARDITRSMMIEQFSRKIADSGGIGIAKTIQAQLLKLQEVGHEHDTGTDSKATGF